MAGWAEGHGGTPWGHRGDLLGVGTGGPDRSGRDLLHRDGSLAVCPGAAAAVKTPFRKCFKKRHRHFQSLEEQY